MRLGGHNDGISNLLFGRVHFNSRWIEFLTKLDVVQEVRITPNGQPVRELTKQLAGDAALGVHPVVMQV
jgi:hypothetical protein